VIMRLIRFVPLVALALVSALAVQPDEVMNDPALESRARTLSAELAAVKPGLDD
jgi:cytochrome c-type biogenesis protein CcmH/NrfF